MKTAVRSLLNSLSPGIARRVPKSRMELRFLLQHGHPRDLVHFGKAPGDDILCTAVIHELARRQAGPWWMMSSHAELFAGNPAVERVIPYDAAMPWVVRQFGRQTLYPNYTQYDAAEDRSAVPQRHIIAEMCAAAGLSGEIALRPHYHGLAESERVEERLIVMQSAARGGVIQIGNKEWYPERFGEVAGQLAAEGLRVVQVGTNRDPPLAGAEDLRGRTSIKELAALLGRARLYIGQVGFPMHLARAAECPGVIVFGGREAPWQSGYACNENLYTQMPCAPCWQWNRCAHGRECMQRIGVKDVLAAVHRRLQLPRGPLEVERVLIEEVHS